MDPSLCAKCGRIVDEISGDRYCSECGMFEQDCGCQAS